MNRVLITGGTRGIGRALVREYLSRGDKVAFVYCRSEDAAAQLEKEGAVGFCFDLSRTSGIRDLVNDLHDRFGGVDVFVSSAGVSSVSLFDAMTEEEWTRVRSIDLDAPVLLTKYLIPGMIAQKRGSIVYISSMWGQIGASCEVAYSAVKAGLLGLTKALAKELGPSGITVNCICPGVIDTDMNASLTEETKRELAFETPLMRLGAPEEVAKVSAFLTSADASFITGQVIGVNGGFAIT